MGHAADSDELFEVAGDELRSIVGDDAGIDAGELLACALDEDLDLLLGHRFVDLPMDDGATVAIEKRGQVVESAADIEVGDVHVPMLMGFEGMLESSSLFRGRAVERFDSTGGLEHAIDAGRADRHDIGVEHHERQPAIAFQRIDQLEVEDGFLFPIVEPVVAGYPCVVLVDQAVTVFPVVELAGRNAQPADESAGRQIGLAGPAVDEVDDLVSVIVGGPLSVQIWPRLFFSATCSPISSAMTSFFC
jgi:hypothetical protein